MIVNAELRTKLYERDGTD